MCGIAAIVRCIHTPPLPELGQRRDRDETKNLLPAGKQLEDVLRRRGPDLFGEVSIACGDATIKLIGASLCLRGQPTKQPFRCANSANTLLFNGEIYAGEVEVGTDENDVKALAEALDMCEDDRVLDILDSVKGPWSAIYWRESQRRLYFGKDVVGRRSLLAKAVRGCGFVVTSTQCEGDAYVEIPPFGMFYADFSSTTSVRFDVIQRNRTLLSRRVADSFFCSTHAFPSSVTKAAEGFLPVFLEAVKRRIVCNESSSNTPRFAILFSGGIDSLFLGRVVDMTLPVSEPVELVNVAFGLDSSKCASSPDRKNALSGYTELLQASNTGRRFYLTLVDVGPEEADTIVDKHVQALLYPRNEPMDRSIGAALWSAARGIGRLGKHERTPPAPSYKISSRILFSGLGIDEMAAGYKRHLTKYRLGGEATLAAELNNDLARLWWRNLGRDDRLISDHGREVRYPFLDEDVISYIVSLPMQSVCNFDLENGFGDKGLLRTAASMIGLSPKACARSKRAIQFGSRSKHVLERKRYISVKRHLALS